MVSGQYLETHKSSFFKDPMKPGDKSRKTEEKRVHGYEY